MLVDLDEATAAILRAEPMLDVRLARPEDAPSAPAPAAVASMESLTAKLEAAEKALAETRAAGEAMRRRSSKRWGASKTSKRRS